MVIFTYYLIGKEMVHLPTFPDVRKILFKSLKLKSLSLILLLNLKQPDPSRTVPQLIEELGIYLNVSFSEEWLIRQAGSYLPDVYE